MVNLVDVFTALGVIVSSLYIYHFLSFLWFYLGRPSVIHTYHHGVKPYALVTGATDGIGKAIAVELYRHGFNLVLHGRNEEKMRKVVEDIRKIGSQLDVQYFLADAAKGNHDFPALIAPFKDLHITLVVHNVGGTLMKRERIDGWDEEEMLSVIRWNVTFPLFLTRSLLPTLRKSAISGSVLVNFVGSQATVACPPRLSIYAASKAFLEKLARTLDNDEQVWDGPTGVHFQYYSVGQVISNSVRGEATLGTPSSETFAKSFVAKMGCGKRTVVPYMVHAAMQWTMELIGERAIDRYSAEAMAAMLKEEAKKA